MDKERGNQASGILSSLGRFLRKCIFGVISAGPTPQHIAFIMDGNRRYAKKWNLVEGSGHRVGFLALVWILQYCYELGVKYVTIYAFSIDNFKRSPEEVQSVMELMQEKIEGLMEEESIVNRYGVRVHFIGNLELLSRSVRLAANRAMAATASNSKQCCQSALPTHPRMRSHMPFKNLAKKNAMNLKYLMRAVLGMV